MSTRALITFVLITLVALASPVRAKEKPVQVYILAGQSNMDGYGGLEALDHQRADGDPDRKAVFKHLKKDGEWVVRDDVWIVYGDRKGPLTAGYGVGKGFMGVEWPFGMLVGDAHDAKVLLIKTSWGGASIKRKFRPPSSGDATAAIDAEYEGRLKRYEKDKEKNPNAKKPERKEVAEIYGSNYRKMVRVVRDTLGDLKAVIPEYDGEGYEIAGLVWFQGFNDQFAEAYKEYEVNLANLIRDVRKEFDAPRLPVVIGQMGHGGTDAEREKRELKPIGEGTRAIKAAQAAVARMDEFKGTVVTVPTDVYWDWKAQAVFDKGWREHLDEWRKIGAHFPFHYLGSPYFFLKAGDGFGRAMIDLHKR